MATTVRLPMKLDALNQADSNAVWETVDGTNFDYSGVKFVDGATGKALWSMPIPSNLAVTPAWNVVLHWKAKTGAGGNAVLTVKAGVIDNAATYDAALTSLEASGTFAVNTSAQLTISVLDGANYDGTLALGANKRLLVEVSREGGSGSDTVGADVLIMDVLARLDIQ